MSKLLITLVVIAFLVVIGWAVYSHEKGYNQPSSNPPAASPSTSNNTGGTTGGTSSSTGAVAIRNMMFTPPQITVQKGGTVTWTNNDSVAHTVTDDLSNVGGPDSGTIQPGASYNFTFNKTGSFQYHCTIHPSMRGTIVVQ